MLRRGKWKYHHYVGFPPELFDLEDPEETRDLAGEAAYAPVLEENGKAVAGYLLTRGGGWPGFLLIRIR